MADADLKFWTTPPNAFLVATSDTSGDILGCISYRQINPTTVEMHRLQVDPNVRGLGIGRKLVQTLMDIARDEGYETVYLETTSPQFEAINLYTKMGFQFLRYCPYQVPIQHILGCATGGLETLAFTHKL